MKRKFGFAISVIAVLLVVVGAYSGYYYFLYQGYSGILDKEGGLIGVRSGTFGDAFGTLNALFSGLAFSGVLITLLMQMRDLAEQRKDSAAARDQNSRQQIESQFYNMLSLQQQVVQSFDLHRLGDHAHTIQGRDCFRDWKNKLHARYKELKGSGQYELGDTRERALDAYNKIWVSHQGDLGLYFRSLYSIFRFIERSQYAEKDFALVVRSLLSDHELLILFYNCLSKKGENFKHFAIKYALFDNLDVDLLLSPRHIVLMDVGAFGGNEVALELWHRLSIKRSA